MKTSFINNILNSQPILIKFALKLFVCKCLFSDAFTSWCSFNNRRMRIKIARNSVFDRQCGDKWQSKTQFLTICIYVRRYIKVFDCRLSGVSLHYQRLLIISLVKLMTANGPDPDYLLILLHNACKCRIVF